MHEVQWTTSSEILLGALTLYKPHPDLDPDVPLDGEVRCLSMEHLEGRSDEAG